MSGTSPFQIARYAPCPNLFSRRIVTLDTRLLSLVKKVMGLLNLFEYSQSSSTFFKTALCIFGPRSCSPPAATDCLYYHLFITQSRTKLCQTTKYVYLDPLSAKASIRKNGPLSKKVSGSESKTGDLPCTGCCWHSLCEFTQSSSGIPGTTWNTFNWLQERDLFSYQVLKSHFSMALITMIQSYCCMCSKCCLMVFRDAQVRASNVCVIQKKGYRLSFPCPIN